MIRTCTNNVGSALASGMPTVVCPTRHTRPPTPSAIDVYAIVIDPIQGC